MTEKMTPEQKAAIDAMDYQSMLQRWRFAPAGGDPIFQGETGQYYSQRMAKLRDEHPNASAVSKHVGWDR